jgi:prostamide/prostaglandin F2alpha synthase
MVVLTNFAANRIYDQRETGRVIKLGDLWAEKPILFLFLRRLGCVLCRNYAMKMRDVVPQFEAKGVQVVAVTFENLGEDSDKDGSFTAGGYWTGQLYRIDINVYHYIFGKKGILGIFDIDKNALREARENKIVGNFKGNGFVLGGQILIAPPGRVVFEHKQARFGDDATVEELLEAIQDI